MKKKEADKLILIINTGTPHDTSTRTVRNYLKEFLMDEYVIDIPLLFRYLLVNGIIAPFRAPQSAKKYASIFENGASPLFLITKLLKEQLDDKMSVPVEFGMRYGEPRSEQTVIDILRKYPNLKQVLIVPLFPQKTQSSFVSVIEHFKELLQKHNYRINVSSLSPFYENEIYINSLSKHIQKHISPKTDKLIFSFHGIPLSHEDDFHKDKSVFYPNIDCGCSSKKDVNDLCYYYQCHQTAQKTAKALGLSADEWEVNFQSRLGFAKWHQPYTAQRLEELPQKENMKNVSIVVPSFLTDCLETLEEIAVEGREIFMEAGGQSFTYIPALNTVDEWIGNFVKIIEQGLDINAED